MKKLLLCGLLSISMAVFAQDKPAAEEQAAPKKSFKIATNLGKNEIKMNAFLLILGAFEVSYERVLTDESSVGVTAGTSFDKVDGIDYNFTIEPYYRYFFGRKPAAGFFIEGFGSLNSRDYTTWNYNANSQISQFKTYTQAHFGLGIGVGGKFITRNNIVFEINAGLGRNLTAGSNNDTNYDGISEKIVGRGGISVGYRF